MRLRQGVRTTDLAKSKALFVSSNKLLVRAARKFVAEVEQFGWNNAPPLMTTGQIATLAWLVKTNELEQTRVSRELLANCYGAMRPDQEWTPAFLGALEKFRAENPGKDTLDSAVFLNTARRIAQDQSLGNSAVLRKLSFLDIFGRAQEAAEEREQRFHQAAQQSIELVRNETKLSTAQQLTMERADRVRARATSVASRLVRGLEWAMLLLFCLSLLLNEGVLGSRSSLIALISQLLLGVFSALSVAEMLGIAGSRRLLDQFTEYLASKIENALRNIAD